MPWRLAASFAFVLSGCGVAVTPAPRAVRYASHEEPTKEPAPSAPAARPTFVPRDDFHSVVGTLFSPDGRWLAVADNETYSFGCDGYFSTTIWLYDTESWQAVLVRRLGYDLAAWAFDDESDWLVVAQQPRDWKQPLEVHGLDLESGDVRAAPLVALAAPVPDAQSADGALRTRAGKDDVEVLRRRSPRPWLRLGPPMGAVATGGALPSGEVFFAARWPNGAFALWDVRASKPIAMDPPPPARVAAVAVHEQALLIGSADGHFWRYGPSASGFAGLEVRRDKVAEAFDVSRFVPRERRDFDPLGGDPDAPLTQEEIPPASVGCSGSRCRFHAGDGWVQWSASEQPGQVTAWDGLFSEPLTGDAATELLCIDEVRVVDAALCQEWTRVPRLFEQVAARAEALRRRTSTPE